MKMLGSLPRTRNCYSHAYLIVGSNSGGKMDCPKCKGLMQLERFSDFFLIFYAWKCINCGAIIDKTIANNRKKSLEARTVQTPAVETTVGS